MQFPSSKDPYTLEHYDGILAKAPPARKNLKRISEYINGHRQLDVQYIMKNGEVVQEAHYNYEHVSSEIPSSKELLDLKSECFDVFYYNTELGYVFKADVDRFGTKFVVEYRYADPISSQELIEAVYTNESICIQTCFYSEMPISKKQIPCAKIQKVICTTFNGTFTSTWDYSHKRHPVLKTYNEHGIEVFGESIIDDDSYGILVRPTGLFFSQDNLIMGLKPGFIGSTNLDLQFNTRNARTALWKIWLNTNDVDGVWARMIDEILLRKEPLLKRYWFLRDIGRIPCAVKYLEQNEGNIAAAIVVDDDISANTHFAIKLADLYNMGIGGDTHASRLKPQLGIPPLEDNIVQVFGLQTGTWPNGNYFFTILI